MIFNCIDIYNFNKSDNLANYVYLHKLIFYKSDKLANNVYLHNMFFFFASYLVIKVVVHLAVLYA